MSSIKRRLALVLGSFVLISGLISAALPAPILAYSNYPLSSSDTEIASALDYLRNNQTIQGDIGGFATSAWVTMAIATAGEDPHDWKAGSNSIVDYLAANAGDATSVTDYARMTLAIVAADEAPTSFGGRDFVNLLKGQYNNGQIGDTSLLNDDFWGVMALISAGESQSSELVANSVAFIKANQNDDGGWSWGVGQGSDVDDTACAVMALIAAGESSSSNAITNGLNYIKSQQADNGGFLSWGATNPSTDSWAIDAIVAAGQNPTSSYWTKNNNTPIDDLFGFRDTTNGSFPDWQGNPSSWTTAYAIPALLGKPYPVKVLQPQEAVSVYVRVEGQSSTIWSGNVTVSESTITDDEGNPHYLSDPTALGALDEASQIGNFTYTVHYYEGLGLCIWSISGEGDWTNGSWWQYRVDDYPAEVGANSFVLNVTSTPAPPHYEILFYSSTTFSETPLKIALNKTKVDVGEEFAVIVNAYSDTTHNWLPCANATVHADEDYVTSPDGTVDISISRDGSFKVFAEKSGYIRSDKVLVKVGTGEGTQAQVSLSANVVPAISIKISPLSIDFGNLVPGHTSDAHTLSIENKGGVPIKVTAQVTDQAQDLFVTGLKLGNSSWESFDSIVNANDRREVQAKLVVPLNYAGVGQKAGTLIFWAEEAS